jgi:hypothetical protein
VSVSCTITISLHITHKHHVCIISCDAWLTLQKSYIEKALSKSVSCIFFHVQKYSRTWEQLWSTTVLFT